MLLVIAKASLPPLEFPLPGAPDSRRSLARWAPHSLGRPPATCSVPPTSRLTRPVPRPAVDRSWMSTMAMMMAPTIGPKHITVGQPGSRQKSGSHRTPRWEGTGIRASTPRALSQRANQKPSRPASKASAVRVIFLPALTASSRQRCSRLRSLSALGSSFLRG
jgi:hypothetical protein